jgi:hypothetical protein
MAVLIIKLSLYFLQYAMGRGILMKTLWTPIVSKNRIITRPVNGGFKKKEPRAEEMKDVWAFLLEYIYGEEIKRDGYSGNH